MREVAYALVTIVALLWIAAVIFGLLAKALQLTARRSWIGRVARVRRAVALVSP